VAVCLGWAGRGLHAGTAQGSGEGQEQVAGHYMLPLSMKFTPSPTSFRTEILITLSCCWAGAALP
jgi:hypothetical protein